MTLSAGAISSEQLNGQIEAAAALRGVRVQRDVRGRDTGTDAMAAALASVDCAATSVGFPIRNMHTTSELAHTADVLGCVEALHAWLEVAAADGLSTADLEEVRPTFARTPRAALACRLVARLTSCCGQGHPRLDHATQTPEVPAAEAS